MNDALCFLVLGPGTSMICMYHIKLAVEIT